MSEIPPPFNWSRRLVEYTWFSERGVGQLRREVGPSLPYKLHRLQPECTARILDGQDVLCVSATGDGKSILMRKGTITMVVCPTNSLESDLVRFCMYTCTENNILNLFYI